MKFPARYLGLFILGVMLAMPVISLNGGFHFLALLICALLLREKLLEPGVWPLCALAAYSLFIGYFYIAGLDELKKINSQQMRQISMMLLAFLALRKASLREIHAFFAFILITAVLGVAGEMTGRNMHDYLPNQDGEHEYYKGAMYLANGKRRYSGFFPESSILLAVTTCFGLTSLVGILAAGRRALGRQFLLTASSVSLLALLFLQAVVYAKTGLSIAVAGAAGVGIALLLKVRREHLPTLVAGCVGVALLVGTGFALMPTSVKDYFADDINAVPLALDHNKIVEQTSSGLLTRIECWRLAAETVEHHPLGVGFYGIEKSYTESSSVMLTGELEEMFHLGIYGLKNTFANVLAQAGVPGTCLLLLALYQSFLRPLLTAARASRPLSPWVSALYLGSLGMMLLFLASCESYYWMALIIILKCYADAVASAVQLNEPEPATILTEYDLLRNYPDAKPA
jgi:hypothetical protein